MPQQVWPHAPAQISARTSAAAFAPHARTGFRYFCSTLLTNDQAT